jgi:hypothetical protein
MIGNFLQSPLGIAVGIALILGLSYYFVFRNIFKTGTGSGGATAPPKTPGGYTGPSPKPPVTTKPRTYKDQV